MYFKVDVGRALISSFIFFLKKFHILYCYEHIFYDLLNLKKVCEILNLCSVNSFILREKIEDYLDTIPVQIGIKGRIESAKRLQRQLINSLKRSQISYVREEDILWILTLDKNTYVYEALRETGFNKIIFEKMMKIHYYINSKSKPQMDLDYNDDLSYQDEYNLYIDSFNKNNNQTLNNIVVDESLKESNFKSYKVKKPIREFAIPLVETVKKNNEYLSYERLIGREEELKDLVESLSMKDKNNPLLIGEPGVGKTAIVYELANRIAKKTFYPFLNNYEIYFLNVSKLLAGTKYRGDFEKRVHKLLDLLLREDKIILFIDEIHTIIGAGAVGEGSLDFANMLKPFLGITKLKIIGTTTYKEFKKYFNKDKAFLRRFHEIYINEPDADGTFKILKGVKELYEKYHSVKYEENVLRDAIYYSNLYIKDRYQPDKAINLLDQAGASCKISKKSIVSTSDFKKILFKKLKVREEPIIVDYKSISQIKKEVTLKLFFQEGFLDDFFSYLNLISLNVLELNKIFIFLFIGKSGLGKRELIKILAKNLELKLLNFNIKDSLSSSQNILNQDFEYESLLSLMIEEISKYKDRIITIDNIETISRDLQERIIKDISSGYLKDSSGKIVYLYNSLVIITADISLESTNDIGFLKRESRELLLKNNFSTYFLDKLLYTLCFFKKNINSSFPIVVKRSLRKFFNNFKIKDIDIIYDSSLISFIIDSLNIEDEISLKKYIEGDLAYFISNIIFKETERIKSRKIKIYEKGGKLQYTLI